MDALEQKREKKGKEKEKKKKTPENIAHKAFLVLIIFLRQILR